MNIKNYNCLLGLPYGYGNLIGNEVYFISDKIYGPWLVVDVESKNHKGTMIQNDLLADTNCKNMVHKKGELILAIKYSGERKLRGEEINWEDLDREQRIREMNEDINKSIAELAAIEKTYRYTYLYTNYTKPIYTQELVYGKPWRESSSLEEFEKYKNNTSPTSRRLRKSSQLRRINLEIDDSEDIKYFYIPSDSTRKIILGAIEFLLKKEVDYTIEEINICYNDLPKFERQRVLGIE